jgi:ATP-binding cassette subfamily B protein
VSRRFFVPEVIQSSAMDCGPAALKSLLEGYGTSISYGRLREACQTEVDGTSTDTIEDLAARLGLDAEQVLMPRDHLLLADAAALPAIVVMRLPDRGAHFVVAWRRHGPLVQTMDPAVGRRWIPVAQFLDECFEHEMDFPASTWRAWAGSDGFLRTLRRRQRDLGIRAQTIADAILIATADPGWKTAAALDAATRMCASIVAARGLRRGRDSERALRTLFKAAVEDPSAVPPEYWWARAAAAAADGSEQVRLRGAVLIKTSALRAIAEDLPPALTAALAEPPPRPAAELWRLVRADGLAIPVALLAASAVAAGAVLLEAVLFRGLLDLARELGLSGQRVAAIAGLLVFLAALTILEFPIANAALGMGRRLEVRLRLAFLRKIPRLGDRYLHSRLRSDMTERSHGIYRVRHLPDLAMLLARDVFGLLFTVCGIVWLDRGAALPAMLSAAAAIVLPVAIQPWLQERDLRVRNHLGALSRYHLDALLGLTAIRCHGGDRAMRAEHRGLLVEWAHASFRLQTLAAVVAGVQMAAGVGFAAWLIAGHVNRHQDVGGILLLVYWALNLPALGQEIAQLAWQYPGLRNSTLRLMEPLGAPEAGQPSAMPSSPALPRDADRGFAIAFEGVSVHASGHVILDGLTLTIEPDTHVAIVGASGAGKSSLVGLLLGWHQPSAGVVRVDGTPIEQSLSHVREHTAWVDPQVHLWNRTFADNLCYGAADGARARAGRVLGAAELMAVLQKLPDGLQTSLGEGGALVSGGEGQRVRLGRAFLRETVRLAVLDEPFRGLDRRQRRTLLARARQRWRKATLLCVTHDIGDTLDFDRVLVVDSGRIVEDGSPAALAARQDSAYRAMLDAECDVIDGVWADRGWRRLVLRDGALLEHEAVTTGARMPERWSRAAGHNPEWGRRSPRLESAPDWLA